ncbi:hypothetical protein KPATCC21470_6557 [Kitasatospora purpeofusca]
MLNLYSVSFSARRARVSTTPESAQVEAERRQPGFGEGDVAGRCCSPASGRPEAGDGRRESHGSSCEAREAAPSPGTRHPTPGTVIPQHPALRSPGPATPGSAPGPAGNSSPLS